MKTLKRGMKTRAITHKNPVTNNKILKRGIFLEFNNMTFTRNKGDKDYTKSEKHS